MNTFIAAFAALLCFGFTATSTLDRQRVENVDNLFANPSYNKVMPVADLAYDDYRARVTERLAYLEGALRSRDVSAWPEELRAERLANIERLHAYRLEGKFPINYDHPDRQLPCFFDRDGNLCAVANLIAKSAGMDLVRTINDRYQYATVSEMKMAEIDAWIAQSGLTREEVITIQEPGFTGRAMDIPDPVYAGMDADIPPQPADSIQYQVADTAAQAPIIEKQEAAVDLSQNTPAHSPRGSLKVR